MTTDEYIAILQVEDDVYTYRQLAAVLGVPYESVLKDATPELTTALENNRERMKRQLRRNWMVSDSTKLQENCYLLMADNDEMVRLGRDPVETDTRAKDPLLNFLKRVTKKD